MNLLRLALFFEGLLQILLSLIGAANFNYVWIKIEYKVYQLRIFLFGRPVVKMTFCEKVDMGLEDPKT